MKGPGYVALVAALGACAGTPVVPDDWHVGAGLRDTAAEQPTEGFTGARRVLEGFDPGEYAHRLERGDRALYGLTFDDGSSDPERWLMVVEVIEPVVHIDGEPAITVAGLTLTRDDGESRFVSSVSRLATLRLTRLGMDGVELGRTELEVPRESITFGLAKACARFEIRGDSDAPISDDEAELFGETFLSAKTLLDVVQRDEMLSDVMWRVARAPSAWSVLTSGFAVHVDLRVGIDDYSRAGAFGSEDDPIYRFPIEIDANAQPSLLVLVDVVEPRSPWNVAAGLVGLTARRPGDENARLTVRLLAARRGPD